MFQFALPRGERHELSAKIVGNFLVSIRAPARGATQGQQQGHPQGRVSIRAPARGATFDRASRDLARLGFNSRSREGSDHIDACTPTHIDRFQFALPRGERPRSSISASGSTQFQFALPRGERLVDGSDILPDLMVSIRAPARGATLLRPRFALNGIVSIRAPARGATVRTLRER